MAREEVGWRVRLRDHPVPVRYRSLAFPCKGKVKQQLQHLHLSDRNLVAEVHVLNRVENLHTLCHRPLKRLSPRN